jgi:plasmid maintenance system antidote protein VapI
MERKNRLPPVHPGEIIREDVLPEVGLSVTAAAKALGYRARCFMTFWRNGSLFLRSCA